MKKLDLYILQRFLPILLMTFFICMLVFEIQFLWKYIDELVQKGIGLSVFAEFLWYASARVVPMALPLAILLASLMTFGNLGENVELTAMKSAGVSLFRIMLPLLIFLIAVCAGAFFFNNNVLPVAQAKLYALTASIHQKSPELDIPPGEFYNGINGYHIYTESKNDGWLKDVMIYDFSDGFEQASVTLADSGKMQITADKKYLLLTLLHGEHFENVKSQRMSYSSKSIPYRRETFFRKEVLLDFDSDFQRYDESVMRDRYISKNAAQLKQTIDSLQITVTSQTDIQAKDMIARNYLGREQQPNHALENLSVRASDSFDTLFVAMSSLDKQRVVKEVMTIAQQKKGNAEFNSVSTGSLITDIKRHQIELFQKFTLSFACLVFFFIGAPLGAIIRKGGLGMPVVISVVMFIIYYIIDTTGMKMAREGLWDAWQGTWLSSAVLLPVGIFLTYKAAVDATLFRAESYILFWEKIKKQFHSKKGQIQHQNATLLFCKSRKKSSLGL